jgi:predicted RNA binding protein YcfA (HicA-like mRNA interferase family)
MIRAHHYHHYSFGVYNATMPADFGRARRQAGNQTARDLVRLGEDAGWTFKPGRGKGSHGMILKHGRRGITIPRRLNDRRLVLRIIAQIEARDGGD